VINHEIISARFPKLVNPEEHMAKDIAVIAEA
jgi:hypothetical protein